MFQLETCWLEKGCWLAGWMGPFPVRVPSGLIDALVEVHLRLILQEGWGEAVPVLWI